MRTWICSWSRCWSALEPQPRALRPGADAQHRRRKENLVGGAWEGKKIGKERENEKERGGSVTVGA